MMRIDRPRIGIHMAALEPILRSAGYLPDRKWNWYLEEADGLAVQAWLKEIRAKDARSLSAQHRFPSNEARHSCIHCGLPVEAETGISTSKYDTAHLRSFGRCIR